MSFGKLANFFAQVGVFGTAPHQHGGYPKFRLQAADEFNKVFHRPAFGRPGAAGVNAHQGFAFQVEIVNQPGDVFFGGRGKAHAEFFGGEFFLYNPLQ